MLAAAQQENGGWGHDDAARPGMGLPPILAHPEPSGAFTRICTANSMAVTCDTRELPGLPAAAAADWTKGGKVYVTAIHALILLLDRTPRARCPRCPTWRGR